MNSVSYSNHTPPPTGCGSKVELWLVSGCMDSVWAGCLKGLDLRIGDSSVGLAH